MVGEVAIRAEIGFEDELMQGLVEARTDIGVMYTPQRRPGMVVEELFEERLVYVSSMRDHTQPPGNDYVYVDWGPEFASQHNAAFPEFDGAALAANIGWIGLQHIIAHGGAGFFSTPLSERRTGHGSPASTPGCARIYSASLPGTPRGPKPGHCRACNSGYQRCSRGDCRHWIKFASNILFLSPKIFCYSDQSRAGYPVIPWR